MFYVYEVPSIGIGGVYFPMCLCSALVAGNILYLLAELSVVVVRWPKPPLLCLPLSQNRGHS